VSLMCETDFVARNSEFQSLALEIAMHIAAMKPANEDELLAQAYIREPDITVKDLIHKSIAKLGENIKVGEFYVLEI